MLLVRFGADDPSAMTGEHGARKGMTMPGEAHPPAEAADEREILYWRAPMDPNYTSDRPGKSPMGMELVPVYADEPVAGDGIRVSRSFLQNFAVRTAIVHRGTLPVAIPHGRDPGAQRGTRRLGADQVRGLDRACSREQRRRDGHQGRRALRDLQPAAGHHAARVPGRDELRGAPQRRRRLPGGDRAGPVAPGGDAGASALLGHDRGADRHACGIPYRYANSNSFRSSHRFHCRQDRRLDGGAEAQSRDDGPQDRRPLHPLGRDRVLRGTTCGTSAKGRPS